jgi:hypothetical protein
MVPTFMYAHAAMHVGPQTHTGRGRSQVYAMTERLCLAVRV